MGQHVLFVSVHQSFDDAYTLAELEPWVASAWAITASKAERADRVVAVWDGTPIAAWRVRGAYATDETYRLSNGDTRPRVGLAVGDPLPILPDYYDVPALRRGVAVKELDITALPNERE